MFTYKQFNHMEITGKIIQILPEESSATDATKQWKK